jgi:hypothetical protein
MAAAYISALDGIIELMEEGVAVADNSVVKVGYLNGFAYWDCTRVQIS